MNKGFIVKTICALLLFGIGVAIFVYPTVSNYINERSQTELINNFNEATEGISSDDKEKSLAAAQAYNAALAGNQTAIIDPFGDQNGSETAEPEEMSFLNLGEMLGYVQIPKIDLKSPVYEGVREEILQKGIGLLPGTSLPVGGASTNTVLSGHRGLPTAKLFTDIDQLDIGDEFFFKNKIEVLAFKVVEKRIIDPNEIEALDIIAGHERMTLLTCHPYMVNTQRLLVIGERVPYEGQLEALAENEESFASLSSSEKDLLGVVMVSAALLIVGLFFVIRSRRNRKKEVYDE